MKKILYLIPLFIFILLISPDTVLASKFHSTLLETPLTVSQKEEYLSTIFSSTEFINSLSTYPYYIVFYQESDCKPLDLIAGSYDNSIMVLMFSEIPSFWISDTQTRIININYMEFLLYTLDINSLSFTKVSNVPSTFYLMSKISYTDDTYYTNLFLDYVIATNIEHIHREDINIYNTAGDFIKTIPKGENVFADLNIRPEIPEETIEPVTDSILNSEDTLYSLSKQLLGELPEEFTFLYSICQLFLGIVIILVVLSPVILLLRLFR